MRRYAPLILLGLVLGLSLVAAVRFVRPYTLRGSTIQQPFAAPDFSLKNGQGETFRLSDQRGRLVLIFFGYTSCPDICPATLGEMKQVRAQLAKDSRLAEAVNEIRYVFITVDPKRDTPEKVGPYVAAFDPAFVGLSGTEAELEPVWKSYGVYRAENEGTSAAGYLVDHTTRIYLVDQAGNLRLTYTFGTPVDDMVQDIRYLLRN